MLRFIVAGLCGISLTGSVYMAGWGSRLPAGATCDACDTAQPVFVLPAGKTDMKNSKCIVEDDDIEDSVLYVEYKDKVYHICCKSCIKEFNDDPEKYVKAFDADPAKFGVKQ